MIAPVSGAARVVEYNLAVYRRVWRGSVLVSFISPLFFLAAMGVGLGDLVRKGSGNVQGVSYLRFLAPGLMAASAMQTALFETTYPIIGKVYWQRIYDAMLATPLTVRDLHIGEIAWLAMRFTIVATLSFVVMALFGVVTSPLALLAIPATVLTGLAFGVPILAFSATQSNDAGFAPLQRFIVMPLFLLSGPFFPIEQLPGVFQAVAWVFPLAHGVALTRGVVLSTLGVGAAALHTAVLLAYVVAGTVAARQTLRRRLVV